MTQKCIIVLSKIATVDEDKMFGISDLISWFFEHPWVIVVILLINIFIFGVSLLFQGGKPGKNPFQQDSTKPKKPYEADQKVRDKVLKQGKFVYSMMWCMVGPGRGPGGGAMRENSQLFELPRHPLPVPPPMGEGTLRSG